MTIKGYLLINTEVGKGDDVVESLNGLEGVVLANRVTGPYDVIIAVETEDLYSLGKFVTRHIHSVPGVASTLTCLTVSEG